MASDQQVQNALRTSGFGVQIGPFSVKVRSSVTEVAEGIAFFYRDHPTPESEFFDFHISINPATPLRRWKNTHVNFDVDGMTPFKPIPKALAFSAFEWGLDYCFSSVLQNHLIVNAAAVEKTGCTLILPAQAGSGKSTLTAGLVSRGWNLLSDELALIPINNPEAVTPVTRPICLKNESIEVVKGYAPQSVFGPVTRSVETGDMAYMQAPQVAAPNVSQSNSARYLVFPRHNSFGNARLNPKSKARAFLEAAHLSFNFDVLGRTGFDLLNRVVTTSHCYDFIHCQLDDAVTKLDELAHSTTSSNETSENTVTALGVAGLEETSL